MFFGIALKTHREYVSLGRSCCNWAMRVDQSVLAAAFVLLLVCRPSRCLIKLFLFLAFSSRGGGGGRGGEEGGGVIFA